MATAYEMFGLAVETELDLPGLQRGTDDGEPHRVRVLAAPASEVAAAFSGSPVLAVRARSGEDETITTALGRAGDVALQYDGAVASASAAFHVTADACLVRCAPADPAAPGWRRALLDTVLVTTALTAGREALHAAGIVLADGRLVAIHADSGGGKSTLTAELLTRGGTLFADDVISLGVRAVAYPGPPLMNVALGADLHAMRARRLAGFRGEQWVEVERPAAPQPRRIDLFVVLDRRPGGPAPQVELDPSPAVLLSATLDSGHSTARRAARFERLAEVAQMVTVVRLTADTDAAPAALADAIERWR